MDGTLSTGSPMKAVGSSFDLYQHLDILAEVPPSFQADRRSDSSAGGSSYLSGLSTTKGTLGATVLPYIFGIVCKMISMVKYS